MPAIFNTIILLGALQGFIISSILYFDKRNMRSNRLLATLLLLMSLASLNLYINYTGWYYSGMIINIIHSLVPMEIVMIMGPLIYFYIRSWLEPDFRIDKRRRYHFLPVIIDLVPKIAGLIFFAGVYLHLLVPNPEPWGIFIDEYYVYVDIPRWVSITTYVILSAKYVASYKANTKLDADKLKWLQQFLRIFMVFLAIWFIYLVPYIIPATRNWLLRTFDWYPIYIPLACLIYWLGIKGYMVTYALSREKKSTDASELLSPAIIEEITQSLHKAMEVDKVYLDPSLNLGILSQHTGISPKKLSSVLNQHLNKSFNEYVNEYRVSEFKKRIFQPELTHLTITGIALECGFNSQATFQRTFKQVTGMSPSEFRKIGK